MDTNACLQPRRHLGNPHKSDQECVSWSRMIPLRLRTLSLLALIPAVVAACGRASDVSSVNNATARTGGEKSTLSLVAYSTPEVVYDEIIPDFKKTEQGANVGFKTSFGASGEQSRAVEGGLPADVVSFSIEPDMERLVKAGLVDAGWKQAT